MHTWTFFSMLALLLGGASLYLACRPGGWLRWRGSDSPRPAVYRRQLHRTRIRWAVLGAGLLGLAVALPVVTGERPEFVHVDAERPVQSAEARFELHAMPGRSVVPGRRPGRLSDRLLMPRTASESAD